MKILEILKNIIYYIAKLIALILCCPACILVYIGIVINDLADEWKFPNTKNKDNFINHVGY